METAATPYARLVLPADGVTFEVTCRTAAGEEGRPHDVTITPDWQLLTPHDLDAERVGVALGGVCSCVDLADRVLPAVRGYVNHRLRLKPAAIVHAENGSWVSRLDAVGCCSDHGFPQARDAAAHLRRPQHWALRYGTTVDAVTHLAQRILDAVAAASGVPAAANQTFDLPGPPAPVDLRLAEPYGLAALWDAGLHPYDVAAILASLPGDRPVGMADVLAVAYATPEPPDAAAAGPARPGSAARRRGRRRPDERAAWIRAGVPLGAVTTILAGNAYSLNDARILANRLSRSVAEAGEILGRWQASGLTPPVDTIVGLHWGPMLVEAPPPAPPVDETLDLARAAGLRPSRLDAALALVRTGTPPAAVAMLADPFRRPDDPYSR